MASINPFDSQGRQYTGTFPSDVQTRITIKVKVVVSSLLNTTVSSQMIHNDHIWGRSHKCQRAQHLTKFGTVCLSLTPQAPDQGGSAYPGRIQNLQYHLSWIHALVHGAGQLTHSTA